MIYIAIVDDKASICAALRENLSRYKDVEVIFTSCNGKEFLEKMRESARSVLPHVVLMDIDMPVMDGILTVAESKLRYPRTRCLMLTIFDEDEKIFSAIKAGADGYLLKDEPTEKIKEAIDNLLRDEGAPMSPGIARKVLNLLNSSERNFEVKSDQKSDLVYNLTGREKEILVLLVNGLEYKEIAAELGISPNTVRNSVSKIYSKLHVTSRMQAAKLLSRK